MRVRFHKCFVWEAGQNVKKGEVLVELDNFVERASLQAAQAQLSALRQTYQRYVSLLNSNAVSRQEMDNAKAAYDAQVAIEFLKQQLNVVIKRHH